VKALTAHKSGTPPTTAMLLSTDMFTLIDEDAIVPFDALDAAALLPGVHGQQPDRRQDVGHPVPALDHRAVLEQGALQGSGLDPNKPPPTGTRCSSTRRSSPSATLAAT
jgi:sn-glycerol 3-phosphate transport system substrate-binding protein